MVRFAARKVTFIARPIGKGTQKYPKVTLITITTYVHKYEKKTTNLFLY